jgi:hypothetical protein
MSPKEATLTAERWEVLPSSALYLCPGQTEIQHNKVPSVLPLLCLKLTDEGAAKTGTRNYSGNMFVYYEVNRFVGIIFLSCEGARQSF